MPKDLITYIKCIKLEEFLSQMKNGGSLSDIKDTEKDLILKIKAIEILYNSDVIRLLRCFYVQKQGGEEFIREQEKNIGKQQNSSELFSFQNQSDYMLKDINEEIIDMMINYKKRDYDDDEPRYNQEVWNQKINEIINNDPISYSNNEKHIKNNEKYMTFDKNYEENKDIEENHEIKQRLDLQNTEIIERILDSIRKDYDKLTIELNKLCNILTELQRTNHNTPVYIRLISQRNILLDKTNYRVKAVYKSIALVENDEKIDVFHREIFLKVKNVYKELLFIEKELRNKQKDQKSGISTINNKIIHKKKSLEEVFSKNGFI